MTTDERIEIEANAMRKATKLLTDNFVKTPEDFNIENILAYSDCLLMEEEMNNTEGRITISDSISIITVNKMRNGGFRNYIISHELGHKYTSELMRTFVDAGTFYRKNTAEETAANQFAAELLMPKHFFTDFTNGKELNFELMNSVANKFNTSLTSSCIRYAHHGEVPSAFILSQDGVIKWSAISDDFENQNLINHMVKSQAVNNYFNFNVQTTGEREVVGSDWIRIDKNYKNGTVLIEENFYLPKYKSVITMLKEVD